jgi:hypothetical protein
LIAFLNARLDEDEARAKRGQSDGWLFGSRALREIEAKRAIMADHYASDRLEYGDPLCARCFDLHPCDVLFHLATVYSDHPDYRQEWAP